MFSNVDIFLDRIIRHELKTVIYGSGMLGKNFRYFLQDECGVSVDYFCDKNPQLWGMMVEGNTKCLSLEELVIRKDECSIIVAVSYRYLDEVRFFFERNHIENYVTCFDLMKTSWMKKKFCRVGYIQGEKELAQQKKLNRSTGLEGNWKAAVYTFITEGYDELHQPLVIDKHVDYFVISDHRIDNSGIFHWIDVNEVVPCAIKDPFIKNRYCKMHGADIFPEYDYSIYLDGALQIAGDIISYLKQVGKTGLALYLNETCECIYETGILITLIGRCNFEMARNQLKAYAMEGMPENYGLLCGGYIFRDNRNALGNTLMDLWWKEYQKWPTRDQLCLTYVMWKMGLTLTDVGILNNGQDRLEDKNIIHHPHCYMKLYNPGTGDSKVSYWG